MFKMPFFPEPASSRKKNDKPARDFMETFYGKWLSSRNNISPAEALHQTRLQSIRDKKPTKDWAPYVLVGR